MWRTLGKKPKKCFLTWSMAGFWKGLHVQYSGMSSSEPEMPSCPVPLASCTAGRISCIAGRGFSYVDFVLLVPGPGYGVCTAWPGGFALCWDTGDRHDINSNRGWRLLELCLSHKQGRRRWQGEGGSSSRAAMDRGGSAAPLSLTPSRSSQGTMEQGGRRAVSESFLGNCQAPELTKLLVN